MSQTFPAGVSADEFYARADALSQAVRELAQQGWTPATSSNFSIRMDENHAAITISGRDKTRLSRDDMMLVDMQGKAVGTASRPSAETELHTHAYLRWPHVNVVLHTHSRVQSIASRLFAKEGVIRFEGWELQKAISGYTTHESVLEVPVFPNTQHMPELVAQVDAWLDAGKPLHAYLINGHGIYTWGKDVQEAKRHLEALEFLLDCELELRRLSA